MSIISGLLRRIVQVSNFEVQPSKALVQRRQLHLAPPFLLDDYIPRYHHLSSVDAAKKRSAAYAHLRECNLCPRLCGVNRYEKTGVCLIGAETVKVNTIAPHFGEGMWHSSRREGRYHIDSLEILPWNALSTG